MQPPALNTLMYVRDHIPLQQGLRLEPIMPFHGLLKRQRPYSITTRIKTHHSHSEIYVSNVRDHIPLQQGLRRLK